MKHLAHYPVIIAMLLSVPLYSCKPGKKEITVGKPAFISATGLNCRKEPSTFGAIVGTFFQGDRVEIREKGAKKETIDGKENYWYLVEKGNVRGWVFGGYLLPALYENTSYLSGNYYLKYGENVQPDAIISNVILNLEGDKYTMISYSARVSGMKAIEENGAAEYLDNMIMLRAEKRKTRPNLLASASPYGDPYQSSYQGSQQSAQDAAYVEERTYTKNDAAVLQTWYIRKMGDRLYLTDTPTISSSQISRLYRYMEKK